jgi:tetratricopeptide (TPR) repeat protein
MILIHPDGLFYFLQGMLYFNDDRRPEPERYAQAEAAFLKAVQARSWTRIGRSAEYCAMAVQWMLADEPSKNPAMLKKAAESMRKLVDSGEVRPDMVQLLIHIACLDGDWSRARWIATRWGKGDPVVERYLSRILFENHAYDLAAEAAEKALRRNATDKGALNNRSRAIQEIEKTLANLKARNPPIPRAPE